jgi:hypothetical protein
MRGSEDNKKNKSKPKWNLLQPSDDSISYWKL